MSVRPLALAAGAAVVVVAAIAASRRAAAPTASEPPPAAERPVGDDAIERPPEFPPVAGASERIAHWVHVLESGDFPDVDWAVSRLRAAGDDARLAVRDAGQAAIVSNPALAEQAVEFLLTAPRDDDAPFARAALSLRDVKGVARAIRLVAAAPGADRGAAARAVVDAALAWGREVRLECAEALATIGGDEGASEAIRLVRSAPVDEAAALYGALAGFRQPAIHALLAEAFASAVDPAVRIMAADALLAGGDPAPTTWLESVVAAPPPGPVDFADAALAALARARHPGALRRIGAVVADAMEDPKRRIAMLERLAPYPLEAKLPYLSSAAADVAGAGDEIRVDVYEALVRAGAPGVVDRLRSFVEKGDLRSANLAALVFGRVRLPEAGRSLLEASRRSDVDDDTRTMLLRAVVLSGSPEHAADVVRAMAQDRVGYDARKSRAQNIASQFGESSPAFRKAAGAALVQALTGEFGGLAGAGLVQIELSTVACCGEEAAPALSRYLTHADLPVRLAAAAALGYVASADTERDLRAAWWTSADPAFRSALATAIERAHFRLPPPKR